MRTTPRRNAGPAGLGRLRGTGGRRGRSRVEIATLGTVPVRVKRARSPTEIGASKQVVGTRRERIVSRNLLLTMRANIVKTGMVLGPERPRWSVIKDPSKAAHLLVQSDDSRGNAVG